MCVCVSMMFNFGKAEVKKEKSGGDSGGGRQRGQRKGSIGINAEEKELT